MQEWQNVTEGDGDVLLELLRSKKKAINDKQG